MCEQRPRPPEHGQRDKALPTFALNIAVRLSILPGGTATRISNAIALARQPFPVGGPVGMCYNLSAPTLLATIPLDPGHQVLPCPAPPLLTAPPA